MFNNLFKKMQECPKCKSADFCKDGIVKGRQRYKCKSCNYRFTVEHLGKSETLKKNALILYLEGLGFRSIGRFLKVSHVSICNWIKEYGKKIDGLRSSTDIEVIELDEMHTYIGTKKNIVGYGLLLIEMGKDSSTSFLVQGAKKLESSSGR
jgi:transposase-like protein